LKVLEARRASQPNAPALSCELAAFDNTYALYANVTREVVRGVKFFVAEGEPRYTPMNKGILGTAICSGKNCGAVPQANLAGERVPDCSTAD
jgi:hypothetical protein